MKRVVFPLLTVVIASILLVSACTSPAPTSAPAAAPKAAPSAAAPKIVLKFASGNPANGVYETLVQWFMDEIKKQSNGGIEFETYWGGSLTKATEEFKAVGSGTVDLGYSSSGYLPTELASWTVPEPYMLEVGKDHRNQPRALRKMYLAMPQMKDELAKLNQRLLVSGSFDPINLWSSAPMNTLASMKGKKIRIATGLGPLVKAVGGVSVSMAATDIYEALQKKTIDAVLTAATTVQKSSLNEVAKYAADMGGVQSASTSIVTINLDTWNKLPKDRQDLILKVTQETNDRWLAKLKDTLDSVWTDLKGKGVQATPFSQADLDAWKALPDVVGMKAIWIKKMDDKGYPGKQMADTYKKILDEERAANGG